RSSAQEAQTAPKSPAESSASATSAAPARSADQVMASLNRAMTWYRQARIVMRAVEGSGVFGPADEQTALRLLGRAFDVAHAEAALLGRDSATASGAGDRCRASAHRIRRSPWRRRRRALRLAPGR